MSDVIATDSERLVSNSSVLISLFELEFQGSIYRYHSENIDSDITFDGNAYKVFPMMMEGIEMNADGAAPRPTLSIANVESLLDSSTRAEVGLPADFEIEDLIGSRITRRRTLQKYTGAVTPYEFPSDTYVIDRLASKNSLMIQLELTSPFDFGGVRVPARVVTGKYCPWVYKGYSSSADNVSSACYWKDELQISGNSFFFSIDDEPFVKESLGEITGATNYDVNTTYVAEQIAIQNGEYFKSKEDGNTGNTPFESSIYWKKIRTFSVWSSDSTGSKQYTTDLVDPRKNSYVYHANTIWRALKPHTKSTDFTPGNAPTYWAPGDVCGKLLTSCKVRYQAVENSLTEDLGNSAIAKVGSTDTSKALPFGGFPGTRKFR